MTVEEILNGESKEVEYKENVPANTKKFTKTAVAFANCAGGLLVFGVENNTWKVTGIPKDKVFEVADSISNAIVDSCEPLIDFDIKYQTIEEKTIIIVQVYPGKRRPYYLKVDGKTEGVYIRVPGSTRLADDYVIKELELEGVNRSYDRMIAVGENVTEEEIEKACDTMYKYALSRCLTPEEKQNVKKVTKNQLLSWGLLQEQDGKMVPTNGYMLLNQNDLQEASVQCGVFKGTTRATFVDKKEYGGTLCEQIDEAYQFVLRNIRMGAEFGGLYRRDVYELPIDSIRELIANAVSHRSYLDPGKVQVALYDDRLEITSPGMLIGGLTIEELKNGYSRPRNRGIVSALAYMKVVEQWGSGIPRLFENCKKAGLREPELIEMGGCFRVNMYRNTEIAKESMNTATSSEDTLQNDASNEGVRDKFGINEGIRDKFGINEEVRENYGETAANILCLMLEKPENTLDSIANTLGVTRRTVEKQVKKLKEVGIVSRVGSNKSGSWKVDIKEDRQL